MKRIFSGSIILLLALFTFAACSSGASPAERSASTSAYSAPEAAYGGDYEMTGEADTSLPLLTPSNPDGTKIVYTVTMELQTTEFEAGTRSLLNVVRDMGGYVQNTYIEGRSLYDLEGERFASYTLRIPSESLAEFLVTMEDNYNLLRLRQDSQDISRQYAQTDDLLGVLREQEERLKAMLGETEDAEEKLALEQELRDVQYEISSLASSSGGMEHAVIYSTVTIQLYEVIPENIPVDTTKEPFSTRASETSSRSWSRFADFCQGVVLLFITLLPGIVVLVIIAAIVLVILHIVKRKKKTPAIAGDKRPPLPPTPPAQPYESTPRHPDDSNK